MCVGLERKRARQASPRADGSRALTRETRRHAVSGPRARATVAGWAGRLAAWRAGRRGLPARDARSAIYFKCNNRKPSCVVALSTTACGLTCVASVTASTTSETGKIVSSRFVLRRSGPSQFRVAPGASRSRTVWFRLPWAAACPSPHSLRRTPRRSSRKSTRMVSALTSLVLTHCGHPPTMLPSLACRERRPLILGARCSYQELW